MIGQSQGPQPDNTHRRQTSMPLAGFESAIPASERSQTHALDHAPTAHYIYFEIPLTDEIGRANNHGKNYVVSHTAPPKQWSKPKLTKNCTHHETCWFSRTSLHTQVVLENNLNIHTQTTVGLLWTCDLPVAGTSTWQHSQKADINAPGIYRQRFNLRKLNEPEVMEQYQIEITNRLQLWRTGMMTRT